MNFVTNVDDFQTLRTCKQVYKAEKQYAWFLGRCATDHSSRTALHAWWRSRTFQPPCLQVPESVDRWRWANCLASTLTWFNSTGFLLAGSFKLAGVSPVGKVKQKQTPWLEFASELYWPSDRRLSAKLMPTFAYNSKKTKCGRFSDNMHHSRNLGFVCRWQWDIKLSPVFRQEVDIWNIYCKVMWRAECHVQTLQTRKLYISGSYVDINYFIIYMRNFFLKLCILLLKQPV
jgi:hypothetical protein